MTVRPSKCLVDTNVFLRLAHGITPSHFHEKLQHLELNAGTLLYTSQVVAEFWSVCSRPAANNGFGLSIAEVESRVNEIEEAFTLLPDNLEVHLVWRGLVRSYAVQGKQVHDTRLVAAMLVHSVSHLLTFNVADFSRYKEIVVADPARFLTLT